MEPKDDYLNIRFGAAYLALGFHCYADMAATWDMLIWSVTAPFYFGVCGTEWLIIRLTGISPATKLSFSSLHLFEDAKKYQVIRDYFAQYALFGTGILNIQT